MTCLNQKAFECRLCLSAKAFKVQTDLMTISSMKRKWSVTPTQTKLEITDILAIEVRGSSLAVSYNIGKATVTEKKNRKKQFFNTQRNVIVKMVLVVPLFTWFMQKLII